MAKFKSFVGKKVAVEGGYFEFKSEEVEVSDKDLIERLKNAKRVEEVKGGKSPDKAPDKEADKK